jgi:hypothetical protein
MTEREIYEKAFSEYKAKETEFNDLHRKAKKLKQDELLPMERHLKKLERKLYNK